MGAPSRGKALLPASKHSNEATFGKLEMMIVLMFLTDPRVPSSPSRIIITQRGHQLLTKVSELINVITGGWDEELVTTTFGFVDARRIMQDPLSICAFDDFIACNSTKNGIFSVRTAYHLEWNHQFGGRSIYVAAPGPSTNNPV